MSYNQRAASILGAALSSVLALGVIIAAATGVWSANYNNVNTLAQSVANLEAKNLQAGQNASVICISAASLGLGVSGWYSCSIDIGEDPTADDAQSYAEIVVVTNRGHSWHVDPGSRSAN